MKAFIARWLATNIIELSTWIGFVMFFREFFAVRPSTLMMILALVLVFVSDAKLNAFIQAKVPGLKKWLESIK